MEIFDSATVSLDDGAFPCALLYRESSQLSALGVDSLVVAKLDGLRFFLLLIHFLGNFTGRRGLQV
jgi:hypothetical protein